jgi:hypothetical protein
LKTQVNGTEKYQWVKSASSCKINDIKGIIYGGISSRFWMLRVHINSIPINDIRNGTMPFYCWECITLEMETKNVDLVIKNEKEMMMLITLIIQKIHTRNNYKGTAEPTIKRAYQKEKEIYYQ